MAKGSLSNVSRTDHADAETLLDGGAMRVAQAARHYGIGRTFLYELMADGKLPYTQVGRNRQIPKAALNRLFAATLKGGSAG